MAVMIKISLIKKHLHTKIKKLAIIKASKKQINNIEYFRYYKLNFYILKGYDIFLNLLKNGLIEISLISRISKSGLNAGRYYNKNLVFQIKKCNIKKLFDEIYYYDSDLIENFEEIQFL